MRFGDLHPRIQSVQFPRIRFLALALSLSGVSFTFGQVSELATDRISDSPETQFRILARGADANDELLSTSASNPSKFRLARIAREYQQNNGPMRLAQGWETIFSHDFEGAWPGPWEAYDINYQNGNDFWTQVTCAPGGASSGIGAAWCAAQGSSPACGSNYDDNMRSWMIAGPFNLSDTTAAEVDIKFINDSEPGHDRLAVMFSPDEVHFYGPSHSGQTFNYPNEWQSQTFDLGQLPIIGSLLGEPLVWIGILFETDSAANSFGGAYVDDVLMRRQVVDGCVITQTLPVEGSHISFPQDFEWTFSGDCDTHRLAFRTNSSSSEVIAIPMSDTGGTVELSDWAEINLFIGSAASYEWSVGEIFGNWYFQRSPWRAFTVAQPCPAEGACCTPHPTTGCDDASCCNTVCEEDAYCCNFAWDSACTLKASQLCGCQLCGNGQCDFDETCATCPVECSYTGSNLDCNDNTIPDGCDIQVGTSDDCNLDGIPDECPSTVCPPFEDNDAFTSTDTRLYRLDLANGNLVFLGAPSGIRWMFGLAIDPTDGGLYGIEENDIVILDPQDGSILWSGAHGLFLLDTPKGLGFDPQGNLFLVHDSSTYSINKSTGAATLLGSNGITDASALTFSSDGLMYAVGEVPSLNGLPGLVRLDPQTGGLLQVLGALPARFDGLDFDSRGILYATNTANNRIYAITLPSVLAQTLSSFALGGTNLAIFRDCNHNGTFDPQDISTSFSEDADGNGIPDECAFCGDSMCNNGEYECICATDCGTPTATESPTVNCSDGKDNDCDGLTDCADANCFFEFACLPPVKRGGPGDILMGSARIDGVSGLLLHSFVTPLIQGNQGAMAIGPDGKLYIAGTSSRNVVRFDLERAFAYGNFVEPESGGLQGPMDIAFGPDGNLYVADYTQHRVLRYNGTTGAFMNIFVAAGAGGLFWARSLEFGPDGHLYVASEQGHAILKYNGQTGAFISNFVPTQSGGLIRPYDFTFGPDGNLYVTHSPTEGAIYRYNGATGAFMDIFIPVSAGLIVPNALAFGPNGDLYVADAEGVYRFNAQSGALIDEVGPHTGSFLYFQPAQCTNDAMCDDANPDTTDICYTFACSHLANRRFYVQAGAIGANDGTSWQNAFVDLQDALAAAKAQGMPAEVWVAAGVYKPGSSDRLSTFALFDGLNLLGGFVGTETASDQRQPDLNLTVLSGDLLANDGPGFANYSDNAFHIVTAHNTGFDAPTILDGFVLNGGNADGPDFESGFRDRGGAIIGKPGCPTITGCKFVGNRGKHGGAVYFTDSVSKVTITNSRFLGNSALTGGSGGGLHFAGTNLTLSNCALSGNTAPRGGGLFISGKATLSNTSVVSNSATIEAGGISGQGSGTTINNSILWGNLDPGGMDESAQIMALNLLIQDSCVMGWTGLLSGTGNTGDCEPGFIDPPGRDESSGTLDDNLRLGSESTNIDAGENNVDIDAYRKGIQPLPATDLAGYPRIIDLTVDRGAYEFFADCNQNGTPDTTDISSSSSLDVDGNSVPDECPPPAVNEEPIVVSKTRFLSFELPTNWGAETAIKITLASLHHVSPPYSGGPSIPFTSFEDQVRWVGPPISYVESASTGTPFLVAQLQCAPHYQEWDTVGLLHVTGSAIVPSSLYEVENVASVCQGSETSCSAVSAPLSVLTTRWGDVETPYNPPSITVQPDIADIGALVNKFRSAPGAPIKARAMLAGAPGNPFGEITHPVLSVDFGFSHISACVDAFRGVPYPYTISSCP